MVPIRRIRVFGGLHRGGYGRYRQYFLHKLEGPATGFWRVCRDMFFAGLGRMGTFLNA